MSQLTSILHTHFLTVYIQIQKFNRDNGQVCYHFSSLPCFLISFHFSFMLQFIDFICSQRRTSMRLELATQVELARRKLTQKR